MAFKRFLLFFLISFFSYSCFPEPYLHVTPRQAESLRVVLVWPSDLHCEPASPIPFHCPVGSIISGEISPSARDTMNRLLREGLASYFLKHRFVFLEEAEAELLLEKVLKQKIQSPEQAVKLMAEETKASSILYLRIYRFKERQGKGFGVSAPASVAFALFLYDGQTGKILWQDVFDETQRPLSENILNLSLYKSIKWLTAEELAKKGLERLLKKSPFVR